jgi:hypothetical protein
VGQQPQETMNLLQKIAMGKKKKVKTAKQTIFIRICTQKKVKSKRDKNEWMMKMIEILANN